MFKRTLTTSSRLLNKKASASASSSSILSGAYKEAASLAETQNDQTKNSTMIDRFIPSFNNKNVYDPFDFSIASQRYQWKVINARAAEKMKSSSFNSAEINPTDFYILPHLLSGYMMSSGQILHRSVTGLSGKKQKQMSKAIRRARSFGLLSSVAKDVSTFSKRGSTL